MEYQNRIRTYPIKSLCIFLAVSFVTSTAMAIGFIFLNDEMWVIRILVWVLCPIFSIASLIVLIHQLFFYVEVRDDYFIKHFLFGSHKIPLRKIDKLVNNDGFYDIYVETRKLASFPTNTKEAQQMVLYFEKKGVKIDW